MSGRRLWGAGTLAVTGVLVALSSASASAAMRADFDGDGRDDLAVGCYSCTAGGQAEAGNVHVIYGGRKGLSKRDQIIDRTRRGIAGAPAAGEFFGYNVAVGDFDRDGFGDLAAAVPEQTVNGVSDAGAVQVIYGSRRGLRKRDRIFHQDSPGIQGVVEQDDDMGYYALTTGDFDGDRRDDLAIEVAGDTVGALDGAGAVNVIYGSRRGLTKRGNQLWSKDTPGIQGDAAANENFGFEGLAAGDFNGDGRDELAISACFATVGGDAQAGTVNVIRGGRRGLRVGGNQLLSQDSPGHPDEAEPNELWGCAGLAAGDFDGNRRDDLAVGARAENNGAGAVDVLYGRRSGLGLTGADRIDQDTPGVGESPEPNESFADSLVAGRFNRGRRADLAVGVPSEALGANNVGVAHVFYGRRAGLSGGGSLLLAQGTGGLVDSQELGDQFGWAFAPGNFNGRGPLDLAVAVPNESIGSLNAAGAVHFLRGARRGISGRGDRLISKASPGILGEPMAGENWGYSLVGGEIN